MYLSVFDVFTVGLGPSSAQTVAPARAARRFLQSLAAAGKLEQTGRVVAELFGALALGGREQGTDSALILGLSGVDVEAIDANTAAERVTQVRRAKTLWLNGSHPIVFDDAEHVRYRIDKSLAFHPYGMRFSAYDTAGTALARETYFSIGDGVVVDERQVQTLGRPAAQLRVPYAFANADQLQRQGVSAKKRIPDLMRSNEIALRSQGELRRGLLARWEVMNSAIEQGLSHHGTLPGPSATTRRAAVLRDGLAASATDSGGPNSALQWARAFATAVAEHNAAGGRVVSAPSNGAAGVVAGVLRYYRQFHGEADDDRTVDFLLAAAAIAGICKRMDGLPAPAVGCQGEVGVGCAMAAAGLAAALGGSNLQVEYAAYTGIEQHVGLSCDPVGGLVQTPCIERNATAAVKAIHAASLALQSDGSHKVSLDAAVRAMHNSGRDMTTKPKHASLSGLAINLAEC